MLVTQPLPLAGYYMFIEASYPRVEGDRAVLKGPWMKTASYYDCYLNFYYHMMGDSLGSLNVYLQTPDHVDDNLGVSSLRY